VARCRARHCDVLARAANQLGDCPFDDVRVGDLYLAIACAARGKQAMIEFDKHYLAGWRLILAHCAS
jgi:hypothetical protein